MIHARSDYNRIQDPEGKIAEDEPVFLLRAKDIWFADTVEYWARCVEDHDKELAAHVREFVKKAKQWQIENTVHLPDAPKEVLKKEGDK